MKKRLRTTPEAKARTAASRSLPAKQIPIGNEAANNFQALSHIQRFAPVDDFEYGLIEELAAAYWRLRQAWALENEMLENAMQRYTTRRQLAHMGAALAEFAAQPKLCDEGRHHIHRRGILLRQIAPPTKKYANEPKTPFPCNEFPAKTLSKTTHNAPKTAPNRPNPTLSPPSGITPGSC